MSTPHKPLDGLAMSLMLLLCVCWGLQQVAVKVALPSLPSTLQIALRSGVAALLVSLFMLWRGTRFSASDGTFWAATTIIVKTTRLSTAAPSKTLLYQLGIGAVLLFAFAIATGNATVGPMTDLTWLSLLFQSVVIAFVSFLTWFWMLRRYLAS